MIRLGLTGYPLGHSLSPSIHEAALKSCGLNGSYSLFPVHPDDRQGLKTLLTRVQAGELAGLNVTIPHKQNVIELLDELTPTANTIGAVNTIYQRENKLIGDNTDAAGFLSDLKGFLTAERHRALNALVLGAGGSARAVVYALLNDGWTVTIAARRIEQAHQLADSFTNYQLFVSTYSFLEIEKNSPDPQPLISDLSLLVNTTPVGMTPNTDQSPWPVDLPLPSHAAIYDLVYNPRETKLVREACSQGRPATTGLGMLVEQAALAFEIWTGHKPDREVMLEAINQTVH